MKPCLILRTRDTNVESWNMCCGLFLSGCWVRERQDQILEFYRMPKWNLKLLIQHVSPLLPSRWCLPSPELNAYNPPVEVLCLLIEDDRHAPISIVVHPTSVADPLLLSGMKRGWVTPTPSLLQSVGDREVQIFAREGKSFNGSAAGLRDYQRWLLDSVRILKPRSSGG